MLQNFLWEFKMLQNFIKCSRISQKCSRIWRNVTEFHRNMSFFTQNVSKLVKICHFSVKYTRIWGICGYIRPFSRVIAANTGPQSGNSGTLGRSNVREFWEMLENLGKSERISHKCARISHKCARIAGKVREFG